MSGDSVLALDSQTRDGIEPEVYALVSLEMKSFEGVGARRVDQVDH